MPSGKRTNPEYAAKIMLNAGVQPLEPFVKGNQPWKCKCINCGNIVHPWYDSVKAGQGACNKCAYIERANKNRNDSEKSINFMLSKGLQPLVPYKSVNSAWLCKCLICGHEVSPRLKSIEINGQGACEYCSGTKIDPLEAINFMISKNLKPLEPFKKSRSKWKCECLKCGDIVYPFYNTIHQGQGGCEKCGQETRAEKLRYTHDEASEIMLKAGCEPLETYVGSEEKWKCRCLKCGRTVYPLFHNVKAGNGGCIFCAEIGFNHNKPAYLYIIFNDELNAVKVGIGNPDSRPDRIKSFLKAGWYLFKKYDFSLGNDAWKIEVNVLRWLRKELKYPPHLTIEQMPKTGGHSETVNADSVTVFQMQKKVEELIKGYSTNP